MSDFFTSVFASEQVQTALINGVVVVVGWIALKVKAYLDSLTKKVAAEADQAKKDGETVHFLHLKNELLARLAMAVMAAQQTIVAEIKAASADGHISAEEGAKIRGVVWNSAWKQFTAEEQAILKAGIADIEAFVSDAIHANVLKLKSLDFGKLKV